MADNDRLFFLISNKNRKTVSLMQWFQSRQIWMAGRRLRKWAWHRGQKCLAPRLISLFLKLPYWGTGGDATFPLIKQGNFRSCCAAKLQLYIMRFSDCLRGSRLNFRALLIFLCFCCVCGWICWSACWPQLRGTGASGVRKGKRRRVKDGGGW